VDRARRELLAGAALARDEHVAGDVACVGELLAKLPRGGGLAEDAVRIGLDLEGLRERTGEAIARWNEVGRGLCERFLAVAATRA
jgi:hypothetical protein